MVAFIKHSIGEFRIFLGALRRGARELSDRFPQYKIGRGSYGPLAIELFGDDASVEIGAFCSFAKGVTLLLGGEHRCEWVTTFPFDRKYLNDGNAPHSTLARGNIKIGNDVWVGRDVLIMSGTTIGNGAIIGARSLVRGTIPPYAIAVGSPAKVVRYRFSPETIARLEALQWWNWPDEQIKRQLPMLMADPDKLLSKYNLDNS